MFRAQGKTEEEIEKLVADHKAHQAKLETQQAELKSQQAELKSQQVELKSQQAKLETQQAKLEAERHEARTVVAGGWLEGEEEFEDVMDDVLRDFVFPNPSDVKLSPFKAGDSGNPYAQAVERCGVPSEPMPTTNTSKPDLLLDRWVADSDASKAVEQLHNAAFQGPMIIFTADGMGKTRLLLQLQRKYRGLFLVYRRRDDADGRSAGSYDVFDLGEALEGVGKKVTDPSTLRGVSDFGMRCLLAARCAVLKRWEKARGPVTNEQWTLAQLHPDVLFEKDVFTNAVIAAFNRCDPRSLENFAVPKGFVTVMDEAHGLLNVLSGRVLPSGTIHRHNLRSALFSLSCEVDYARGNSIKTPFVIFSGTSHGMAVALRPPNLGLLKPTHNVFFDLSPFRPIDVARYLSRVAGVVDPPPALCRLLAGRPRFTTSFVDFLVGRVKFTSLLDSAEEFVKEGISPVMKQRQTIGGMIARLRNDPRYASVQLPDPHNPSNVKQPIEKQRLFAMFERAAFDAVNGGVPIMDQEAALCLVEVGVLTNFRDDMADSPMVFEPLVLRAMLENAFNDDWLREVLHHQGRNSSARGAAFEHVVGYRLGRGLFHGASKLEDLTFIKPLASNLPDWVKGASFRAFEPKLGRVGEPGNNLFAWFERHLKLARSDRPGDAWMVMGKYPGRYAGPDYAMLCRVVLMGGTEAIALVLVQVKLTKTLDSKTLTAAKATVDPALTYHVKRTTAQPAVIKAFKEGHEKFIASLVDVPVIRIVVAAGSVGEVEVEAVTHTRPDAVYKEDLLLVIRGQAAVEAVFGSALGKTVATLKTELDEADEFDLSRLNEQVELQDAGNVEGWL